MNTNNYTKAPTREESISYFEKLSALGRPGSDFSASAMLKLDEHTEVLIPRVMVQTDEPDVDPNSLAEVGKDEPVVIAFADGVSPQNRKAVLLSMKFSEAAARAQDDGSVDRIEWLDNYEEAMFHAGWLGLGGKHFSTLDTQQMSVTMDALVIDLIGAIAGRNTMAVIELLSLTLDKLQGSDALTKLFESNSTKGSTSSFRIMPCLESSAGIPVTYLLAMEVDFSKHTGGALFWKWSISKLSIREVVVGLEFDLDSHNDNKHLMRDYIKGNAEDYFAGLPRG